MQGIVGESTLDDLEAFLQQAPPAVAFALWSAIRIPRETPFPGNGLRSAGIFSISADWETSLAACRRGGSSTFKVKMGMDSATRERRYLGDLLGALTDTERIRLDANMSLDKRELDDWTRWLAGITSKVEYIEEPLPVSLAGVQDLTDYARHSPIPLGLDESLSRDGIRPWLDAGWPGYWIIKPAIMGSPDWMNLLDPEKTVLSSVFETGIGMNALLAIGANYSQTCHGLGTGIFFNDGLGPVPRNGRVGLFSDRKLQNIWKTFYRA